MHHRKSDEDILDYVFDYRLTKALTDDPIASATVTELTTSDLDISPVTITGKKVSVNIGGGTSGENYQVKILVITDSGQVMEDRLSLDIAEPL